MHYYFQKRFDQTARPHVLYGAPICLISTLPSVTIPVYGAPIGRWDLPVSAYNTRYSHIKRVGDWELPLDTLIYQASRANVAVVVLTVLVVLPYTIGGYRVLRVTACDLLNPI